MASIDTAIAEARSCSTPNITAIARAHHVSRETLRDRLKHGAQSRTQKARNQCLLTSTQEKTLIDYINKLTTLGIPPTPAMVTTFASDIVKKNPGKSWCRRFVQKHHKSLNSHYLKGFDSSRKKADNVASYKMYFDLVKQKTESYGVEAHNTYNMDEKGFLIGMVTKTMRIFSKSAYNNGNLRGVLQDGNREWITMIGCICGDGTEIPPALIYKGESGRLQDSWFQDLTSEHKAFFASSPTGWTNDDLGFEWLLRVSDRFTKQKARNGRDWRLLYVDGHGSHINMRWLDWCAKHQILVMVYPPHSTHRLQPLDVSVFGPMAIYYSQELSQYLHRSQGLSSITKRDFLQLFWPAYQRAFSTSNITSSWQKTGLLPYDPSVVLASMTVSIPSRPSSKGSGSGSAISASDWRNARGLFREVVKEQAEVSDGKVKKVEATLVRLCAQVQLLTVQNEGLTNALSNEKKRRKPRKALMQQIRADDGSAATFWSPTKVQQAMDLQEAMTTAKTEETRIKAVTKAQKKVDNQLRDEEAALRRQNRIDTAIETKKLKAAAETQKAVGKEGKKASQQLQLDHSASLNHQRRVPAAVEAVDSTTSPEKSVEAEGMPHQAVTRSGRITQRPRHLST